MIEEFNELVKELPSSEKLFASTESIKTSKGTVKLWLKLPKEDLGDCFVTRVIFSFTAKGMSVTTLFFAIDIVLPCDAQTTEFTDPFLVYKKVIEIFSEYP